MSHWHDDATVDAVSPRAAKAAVQTVQHQRTCPRLKCHLLRGPGYSGYPPGMVPGMLKRRITPHWGCFFDRCRDLRSCECTRTTAEETPITASVMNATPCPEDCTECEVSARSPPRACVRPCSVFLNNCAPVRAVSTILPSHRPLACCCVSLPLQCVRQCTRIRSCRGSGVHRDDDPLGYAPPEGMGLWA